MKKIFLVPLIAANLLGLAISCVALQFSVNSPAHKTFDVIPPPQSFPEAIPSKPRYVPERYPEELI